jgi:hypothetical protein
MSVGLKVKAFPLNLMKLGKAEAAPLFIKLAVALIGKNSASSAFGST